MILNQTRSTEFNRFVKAALDGKKRLAILNTYFYRTSGSRWVPRVLRGQGLNPAQFPSDHKLRDQYSALCLRLQAQYGFESYRTDQERHLFETIKQLTKIKFERSIWIGNHSIDLFTPSLAIREGQTLWTGFAIEVDGSVHDREFKMKKDRYLEEALLKIRIPVLHVTSQVNASDKIRQLLSSARLSTTKQRRILWRRIYLSTILVHASDAELANLFCLPITCFDRMEAK